MSDPTAGSTGSAISDGGSPFADAPIERDRERFLHELLGELISVLEDAVGLEDSEGFVGRVGARLGEMMKADYSDAVGGARLNVSQVAHALTDLKRRINGGFSIERIENDRIVLVNDRCPFGELVHGKESLCMMTSAVFGRMTASNLDYARVVLEETIARGDGRCRVSVFLVEGAEGREYFA